MTQDPLTRLERHLFKGLLRHKSEAFLLKTVERIKAVIDHLEKEEKADEQKKESIEFKRAKPVTYGDFGSALDYRSNLFHQVARGMVDEPGGEKMALYCFHHLFPLGLNLDFKNEMGNSSLHYAAYAGHAELVSLLVAHGADVNIRDASQATPLHDAAYRGQVEISICLLQAGADLSLLNDDGHTAYDSSLKRLTLNPVSDLLKTAEEQRALQTDIAQNASPTHLASPATPHRL